MQGLTWLYLGVAALVAMVDWLAVATDRRSLEWFFKPATIVMLLGVLYTLELPVPSMRGWFAAALTFSLIGDVFLISQKMKWFVPGVAAFLLGHVMYVLGFLEAERNTVALLGGVALMAVLLLSFGPTLLVESKRESPALPAALAAYMATIAVMVCGAFATGSWVAMVGSSLFAISDFVIGFTRFVQPIPQQRIIVMTTYHVAQTALVLSLLQMS
ncbi:MAG: lysoplasmalogenase [Actinobacteria bacterium]|nr:lysoplasmalogenase [Actinomycetota bacterium]